MIGLLKNMEFHTSRHERKFVVSLCDRHDVEAALKDHPSGFYEQYPHRYVNSIYYDSLALSAMQDNLSGASKRVKLRVRWYGDIDNCRVNPVLEFKLKQNDLGDKVSFSLGECDVDDIADFRKLRGLMTASGVPRYLIESLPELRPVVVTRYGREYYVSLNEKFRVTIDDELSTYGIARPGGDVVFLRKMFSYDYVVVELKYRADCDELARSVTARMPLRMSKNSKYVNAMMSLFV